MPTDRDIVRSLATRWLEIASQPIMEERKRQWRALKDLRPERPMVLFETWTLEDYVSGAELQCTDPLLRGIEHHMRWTIRQAEEVGDDIVLEPTWRVGYDVRGTGYGVSLEARHATDSEGGHVGYAFDHPIQAPADVDRLVPQSWSVDRKMSQWRAEQLDACFGDILPVVLHGTQGLHAALTGDLFRLVGNNNLMTWLYDEPAAIHRVMAYLRDDRIAYNQFLESEGLLGLNNHWTFVGSGSPGYISSLPAEDYTGRARLKDLWVWMESQETTGISPRMFARFCLPYMAEVSALFGRIYYGCCEPVHDRWDLIMEAIPHIGAVSVSPWCDMVAMAEKLAGKAVFARKPWPAPISGASPDWDALQNDLTETVSAAAGGALEIVYRDVYRIHGDRARLARWTAMARDTIDRHAR